MNQPPVHLHDARPADAAQIADIYNHYILHSTATLEERPVTADELATRIAEVGAASLPWLVADTGEGISGYAYAGTWKGRCAYRYAVETTIYVAPGMQGRGIGTRLYTGLIDCLRGLSIHAAMGGIALPNAASIALQERVGFEKVAHFREAGYKFQRWIDVGYWELILT